MSLANAILSAEDIEKELNADTEDLERELEKLRELRAAAAGDFRPSSRATRPAESPDISPSIPDHQIAASIPEAPSRGVAASLADQILQSSDIDDVEKEFQAMEQELQQQLLKYKEQCQGVESPAAAKALQALNKDGGVLAPGVASGQDAATTVGSGSWPSRPSSESSAKPPATSPTDPDLKGGNATAPELLRLRAEASKMEDIFPELLDSTNNAEVPPLGTRHRRIRRSTRDTSREEVPEDPETQDLREFLGRLDVRLAGIQQRHAMQDVLEREDTSSGSSAAAKAIHELRAQNDHLRQRFQASDKRGLLGIDTAVFGASDPRHKP
jgi:hypothetical protein